MKNAQNQEIARFTISITGQDYERGMGVTREVTVPFEGHEDIYAYALKDGLNALKKELTPENIKYLLKKDEPVEFNSISVSSNFGLDLAWRQVRKFHKAFGHPVEEKPTMLTPHRAMSRANWIIEEVNEFLEAKTVTDQADACIDAIYFLLGNLVEMGVEPQALFDIVQGANMAKLFPDGKPHYREDGKVIKPEGWQPPEPKLEEEIKRQLGGQGE